MGLTAEKRYHVPNSKVGQFIEDSNSKDWFQIKRSVFLPDPKGASAPLSFAFWVSEVNGETLIKD